jgi:hypothetical protein
VAAALGAPARAQATKKAAAAPAPPDTRPLARYVPRDNLVIYLGSDGLDAQADAWKKTAAYKLLTETSLGGMLEDMTSQVADKLLASTPNRKLNGADVLTIIKQLASSGFVAAVNGSETGKAGEELGTIVIRGGAGKDVRATFSRLMGTFMGTNKPQVVKKSGRTIVVVPMAGGQDTWAWWSEQNDLVIAIGKDTEDAIIATIDGKRPAAVEHPVRAELARTESGFTPLGQFLVDPTGAPKGSELAATASRLTSQGVNRVDVRWGFQDDALMMVTRLKAPRPRRGLLALADQPTFDKAKLPPLPEGIESFTVVSVDTDKAYDTLLSAAPTPEAKAQLSGLADSLKTNARIDLRKDLLARLGPKTAVYLMPGTTAGAAAPAAPAAGGGPLAGLLNLGGPQIPRLTLATEVDDTVAFARTLDNLIVSLNKEMRERVTEAAERAPVPKAEPGGDQTKGRRQPPQPPEFKLTPSKDLTERSYVLNIPPNMAGRFPAGFRPTIRLGAKKLVISTTPDAARLAMEVKAGDWTPPPDLAPAFDPLPRELIVLSANDPRTKLPEILASLPAALQRGVNSAIAATQAREAAAAPGGAPPGAAPPGAPGGASVPPAPGGPRGPRMQRDLGMPVAPGAPGAPGPGGQPQPGGPGGPPGAATSPMIQFNIPADKLPKADEIRARLFPGSFAVSADDQEIRFISRTAFPNVISPSTVAGIAVALPAIRQVQAARSGAPAAPPAEAKAATTKPAAKAGSSVVPKD